MPLAPQLSTPQTRAALKRACAVTLACALVGTIYALVAPRWYSAELSVVPARQPRTAGFSSILGGELGGLMTGLDSSLGGSADVTRIAAVLRSNSVSDAVIEKFGLRERYDTRYQETARQALWTHCDAKVLPKPNLVQLVCEDKDPRFVQEMLGYFAEYGNQVFRRVGVSSATEEVRFLERRVAELRKQADESAARMREFQEKHRIVDLESQARAVVASLAGLNSQSISKQLELEYARTFSARDEATTRQLQSQLRVVEEKLRELQVPAGDGAAEGGAPRASVREAARGMFPAALAVPALRAEYEGLLRDRKVAEATLVFALERLEGAKANEARDVSTFVVLDAPSLPTRPARPKRLRVIAALAAIGLAASLAWEWWRRRDPSAAAGGNVARAA